MASGLAAARPPGMTTPLQVQPAGSNTLRLRILSALVLAPLAVAVAWFGSPWLPLLTAVAGAVIAWEWARLCNGGLVAPSGAVLIALVVIATGFAAAVRTSPAFLICVLGAAGVFEIARLE